MRLSSHNIRNTREHSHFSPHLYSRLIAALNPSKPNTLTGFPACELDSHADTSVAGCNFALISEPTRRVAVHGYSKELPALADKPVASAATVYMDTNSGKKFLLVLHECLFMGERMDISLLCPNQLRMHGIVVEDTPRQFCQHFVTVS